ncbi:haloacid dehalogenase-like hydrolase (HAD) superfamily protein [Actinidia rufa]|uniref:Haloacid dehalogenase-like hydrolase (HAD) superfamily protein n=1 Tax=Actinidia rufa TaxID=165716 RepID=A0A7J0FIT5_9ERIC|nr:haloacid dehalogenase-like hydrolase (HAD) superfamily protein [Actinidia rufa]
MDDTLYPLSSGLNLACHKNIEEFMLRQLHIDDNEVPRMRLDWYREYGTTMAGLKVLCIYKPQFFFFQALGYEFDNDEFHAYVHGKLPYEALKPYLIFTNADKSMQLKSSTRWAWKIVFKIFFDDSTQNIASGKAAGLHTVIVTSKSGFVGSTTLVPGADHALRSIHNIKEALPEIWEGEEGEEQVIQSTSAETIVLS